MERHQADKILKNLPKARCCFKHYISAEKNRTLRVYRTHGKSWFTAELLEKVLIASLVLGIFEGESNHWRPA